MNTPGFLIAIAPLLVLVVMLLVSRYPGEAAIERLRTLIESIHQTVIAQLPDPGRLPDFEVTPRGASLLGCSLAGRAPPFATSRNII